MKYLVVKFYDNDFGHPMMEALTRLRNYIRDNVAAYTFLPNHLTLTQIYLRLHECGALQPMILRLFVLENLCRGVEQKTRSLHHWDKWTAEDVQIANPSHLEPDTYLRCDVAFYGAYEVIPDIEWANGENVYMDLETGIVGIF